MELILILMEHNNIVFCKKHLQVLEGIYLFWCFCIGPDATIMIIVIVVEEAKSLVFPWFFVAKMIFCSISSLHRNFFRVDHN